MSANNKVKQKLFKDYISLGQDLLLCQVFLQVRHSLEHLVGRLLLAVMAFPGSGVACLLSGLGTVGKVSCHSLDRKGQFVHANITVTQEISPLVE